MRRRQQRTELPDPLEILRARRDLRIRASDPLAMARVHGVVARIREASDAELAQMDNRWHENAAVLLDMAAHAAEKASQDDERTEP